MLTHAGKVATVLLAAAVVGVAGCGGTSYNKASNGSNGTSNGGGSTSPTTASSNPDAQAMIDAAAKGVQSSDSGANISSDTAHCFGAALVNTLGVDRLKAAGVTAASLGDSSENLPAEVAKNTPSDVREQLGAALQACGFGEVIGPAFAKGFVENAGTSSVKIDSAAQQCLSSGFDSSDSRLMIADLVLGQKPSSTDAGVLAGLMLQCINLTPIFAAQFGFPLTASEQSCIDAKDKSNPTIRKVIAAEIAGTSGSVSSSDQTALGTAFITCLTPAHIAQLGQKGG